MLKLSKIRTIGLAACFASVTGCASLVSTAAPGADTIPQATQPAYVALNSDCLLTPRPSSKPGSEAIPLVSGLVIALADAAIPAATSFIFDRIAAAAKAKTRERTSSSTAKTSRSATDVLYIYTGDGGASLNAGCITFVRPSKDGAGLAANYKSNFDKEFTSDWRTILGAKVEGINGNGSWYPELFAEFRVVPVKAEAADKTPANVGFYLEPAAVAFGQTGAVKTSSENAKDVGLTIKITGFLPDGKKGLVNQDIYKHEFAFLDLKIGTIARITEVARAVGPDKPDVISRESTPSLFAGQSGPIVPLPSGQFKLGGKDYKIGVPLEVTVIATELEDGGDLQRAIITDVEKAKDKITGPIDQALSAIVTNAIGESKE